MQQSPQPESTIICKYICTQIVHTHIHNIQYITVYTTLDYDNVKFQIVCNCNEVKQHMYVSLGCAKSPSVLLRRHTSTTNDSTSRNK